jgi:hypothetical protein
MNTGYIYIIKSNKTDNVYIGSTKHNILKRFKSHEHDFAHNTNNCSSKEIIKYGDAYCEILEKIKYDDIKNLREREKEIIQSKKYKCINSMWNTLEEDDVIITQKQIENEEKRKKNIIIANKIISVFENNKIYSKNEFDVLLPQLPYDDLPLNYDQIKDRKDYKKILGCINTITKYINIQIIRINKKKRIKDKIISVNKYKMIEKKKLLSK